MRQEQTLMEKTRTLLRECGRTLPEVYAELAHTGSDISFYWLRKFSAGAVQDPSVNKVEELYRHLTGKPLIKA